MNARSFAIVSFAKKKSQSENLKIALFGLQVARTQSTKCQVPEFPWPFLSFFSSILFPLSFFLCYLSGLNKHSIFLCLSLFLFSRTCSTSTLLNRLSLFSFFVICSWTFPLQFQRLASKHVLLSSNFCRCHFS